MDETADLARPGMLLDTVLHLPAWLSLLVVGLILMYSIGLAGFILARAGRSPLWSLLLLVPVANVVGVWVFAYGKWPRYERACDDEARQGGAE